MLSQGLGLCNIFKAVFWRSILSWFYSYLTSSLRSLRKVKQNQDTCTKQLTLLGRTRLPSGTIPWRHHSQRHCLIDTQTVEPAQCFLQGGCRHIQDRSIQGFLMCSYGSLMAYSLLFLSYFSVLFFNLRSHGAEWVLYHKPPLEYFTHSSQCQKE